MGSCCACLATLGNSCKEAGTTPFERIFMSQEASAKDSIFVVMELLVGEPDFTLDEVMPNVHAAVAEHPRLREVLTNHGLWIEVEVDVASHVQWVHETTANTNINQTGTAGKEESKEILEALAGMPAFEDESGETPRWQVLVTKRKIIFQVHHAAVDGVGVAMITGTLLNGATLADLTRLMPSKRSQTGREGSSGGGATRACQTLSTFTSHVATPVKGLLLPNPKSSICDPTSYAEIENVRHIHLGPYSLQELKNTSKKDGVTLNTTVFSAVLAALRDYCKTHDEDDVRAFTVAVPINFKQPSEENPKSMRANNDFSTMMITVPVLRDDVEDEDAPPFIDQESWSRAKAVGAWAAQASLSLLPRGGVAWIVRNSSKLAHLAFSNVNASFMANEFVSQSTGARKKVTGYGYGSLNGAFRIFVIVTSHGNDVHIGLTVDETVVLERNVLAKCINQRILNASSNTSTDGGA